MKLAAFLPWALLTTLAPAARSQSILYTFDGASPDDQFGSSVSAAGDVNGDGFEDIIVGARLDDISGTDAGSATVFSGLDGSVLYSFSGLAAGDWFGQAICGVDVNNDGFSDIVVGAHLHDSLGVDSGSVWIFSGLDGSLIYKLDGAAAGDWFGASVGNAGDVDGDGHDDFIIGAYGEDTNGTNSGIAQVYSGQNGSLLHTFNGGSADDWFGFWVSGAGDVDDDGYADLIVGARGDSDSEPGWSRVFSGFNGATIYTFNGTPGAQMGNSVSGAGDVNADGFDDVIVGAHQTEVNSIYHAGRAQVFSGLDGSTLFTFDGNVKDSHFGFSVSGPCDVNRDGYADLIVGAFWDDNNGPNSGTARVFSGLDGSILYTFDGDSADDWFGHSVNGADVDGDGAADLIVGAAKGGANGGGYARVFSGCDACMPQIGTNYCTATTNSSGLPASIAGFGSEIIADNDVTLETTDVAPNQYGYYLMSDTQAFVPLFGGSQGNLCLGSPLLRFAKDVKFSGTAGVITLQLDLTSLPQATVFQPGETWNFQLWFRDVNPGFTSNTSDGLAITFQ